MEKDFFYSRIALQSLFLNSQVHYGRVQFFPENEEPAQGTLYFLHGGSADDRQLPDAGIFALIQGKLAEHFRNRRIQIILPYIGNSFLRQGRGGSDLDYSRYFFQEVMSAAEKGTSTHDGARWIAGLSMGGQAALNAFFRQPKFFVGVGAHFPTVIDFDYNDPHAVERYSSRTLIQDPHRSILISELQTQFPGHRDFSGHDPISLARLMNPELFKDKRIYFDVGGRDEFGLFEGASSLHKILNGKQIKHSFELVPDGKHDPAFISRQFPKLLSCLLE